MTLETVSIENLLAHQAWANRIACQLVRDPGEAEELVQRTWLTALRSPPRSLGGLRPWIGKVLLNLARQGHRQKEIRRKNESILERREMPDTAEEAAREEIRELLATKLLALREPFRTVLLLRFYETCSSAEIARRLGVPPGTIRWRLKTALDELRRDLDRASGGDRERWLSALLVLLPRPMASPDDPGLATTPAKRIPTPSLFQGAAGVGFVAAGLGLGFLVLRASTVIGASAPEAPAGAIPHSSLANLGRTEREARAPHGGTRLPVEAAPAPSSASETGLSQEGLHILVVNEGGVPVPQARVLVASRAGFEERGKTDPAGELRLAIEEGDLGALGIPATRDRITLRAEAEGLAASDLWHVSPPAAGSREIRLVLGGPERVLLGRVLDPEGHPFAGAPITAEIDGYYRASPPGDADFTTPLFQTTRSREDGSFEFRGLEKGTRTFFVSAPGFLMRGVYAPLEEGAEMLVRLERGCTLTGTIRRNDSTPAAGARVWFEPVHRSTEWSQGIPGFYPGWRGFTQVACADERGAYRLEGVPAGRRRLFALEDGAAPQVATIALELDEQRSETWDPLLAPSEGIRLRVVDELDRPLPGWLVYLRRPTGDGGRWVRRLETDAGGRVRIPDCLPGDASLDVYDPTGLGASYATRKYVRPLAEEQTITVAVEGQALVRGVLLDAGGSPFEGGELSAYSWRTGTFVRVELDASGAFEQRLADGPSSFVFRRERSAFRVGLFELQPGEIRDLGPIRAPSNGTLRIQVPLTGQEAGNSWYVLYAVIGEQEHTFEVDQGALPIDETRSVFAGQYRLVVHDGSSKRRNSLVRVEPNGEALLAIER